MTKLVLGAKWDLGSAGRVKRWARGKGPAVELTVGKALPLLRIGKNQYRADWATLEATFLS